MTESDIKQLYADLHVLHEQSFNIVLTITYVW